MNSFLRLFAALSIAGALAACSPSSSSTIANGATAGAAWDGKVVVSQDALTSDVQHEVIGTVSAAAKGGYGSVDTLYPLLADEARKIGANGVVSVKGGRRPALGSWAAPYADGTAIKVSDPDDLKGISGGTY